MNRSQIFVRDGDITKLEVDAISNAANGRMLHGGGVAAAIAKAGGETVSMESLGQATIPLTHCAVTRGGFMPCKFVIHTVVMELPGSKCDPMTIWKATKNTLAVADGLGCKTLALPAFGTGVGGVPMGHCAEFMFAAVQGFQPTILERVTFTVFGSEAFVQFGNRLF